MLRVAKSLKKNLIFFQQSILTAINQVNGKSIGVWLEVIQIQKRGISYFSLRQMSLFNIINTMRCFLPVTSLLEPVSHFMPIAHFRAVTPLLPLISFRAVDPFS